MQNIRQNMEGPSQPAVSVIIPTFNRAGTLPRAIKSVFEQTLKDWELIVVDDASVDGTPQLIRGLSDGRIKYLRHENNRGPSGARNSGIEAARGTYIAFLDSDDEWLPEKLARDVQVFSSSHDMGLVYTGEYILGPQGSMEILLPTLQGRVYKDLLARDFIGSCSRVAVRRDALETAGKFDEQLVNEEDWDLWLRIAKSFSIGLVTECLVKHYVGHEQLTSRAGSLRRIYDGRARIIAKHRERMAQATLAKHLGEQAGLLLNYDIPGARKLGFESLGLKPLQPRLLAALGVSLLGSRAYRIAFSQWAKLRHGRYMGRVRA
jgi:glycosyltransferase involved in cell wall biosynthesis